jgi:hypothetical protein
MSVTVSNCVEINRSPVNSSKAKMLYTFSKDIRFKPLIKSQYFYYKDQLINFMKSQPPEAHATLHSVMVAEAISLKQKVSTYTRLLPTTNLI